jgi:hypothetical protein
MRKNLFLYLALACFLALIVIFVADGYMGTYDTIYITTGEQEQVIEPDYWLQPYSSPYPYYVSAQWGQRVFFRYEIDNRQFSAYSTTIQASLWQENEKLFDLFSAEKSIGSFDRVSVEWTLTTDELDQPVVGASNQYTVKISYGDIERRIMVDFYYPAGIIPPEKVR